MSSYTDVKNLIISNIKANGQREITGPILQDVLLNMLENSSSIEEITYSDLKALRDESKLTPSRLYRITDYITTTLQSNTKSAGHPFDIIVLALSETELLEQAWAIQHEGDEYFTNSNLSAWQIWYSLDNDTSRFAWADSTNGKGVIYRMIDEWNNDVPYDFKNIQFKHPNNPSYYSYYYYTFASGNVEANTDCSLSISNRCHSNTIKAFMPYHGERTLNNIIFIGSGCYNNSFESCCYNNSFESNCYFNSFGVQCFGNSFRSGCNSNSFKSYCYNNTIGSSCYHNSFGNYFNGNNFYGGTCYSNFGEYCSFLTLDYRCYYNHFGNYCSSISMGSDCSNNSFSNYCGSIYLGYSCNNNSFGNNCKVIKFESGGSSSTKYNYYQNNHFGDGCQYILFKGAETASSSAQVQNYKFAQGTSGTSSAYLTIDGVRNLSYEAKVAKNSKGELKIYCEADLIR